MGNCGNLWIFCPVFAIPERNVAFITNKRPKKVVARGSNYLSLDVKGRMSIPTKHRAALIGESEGRLVVTISPTDKCLLLYKLDDWNAVEQKLVALPTLNAQTRTLKRMLIGNADDCAMDGNGRILLPEALR